MKIQQYCLISSVLTNNRNTCRLRSCLKWMKRYSNLEMTDMHLMYGLAMCNASKAKRLYSEYFPIRRIPNKKTFQKIHERLWETACFQRRSSYTGRPINRNCRFEEWVLHHVKKNTEDSTRKIARTENAAHVSVENFARTAIIPFSASTETDLQPSFLYLVLANVWTWREFCIYHIFHWWS